MTALLPPVPHFAAPFPRVESDAATIVPVAPGIEYGEYVIVTADGPFSVHVVAADLHRRGVRSGAVLAQEHLISAGETVSSMAYRTGAVAGINGDYFDIDQTNEPLNILIENGRLIRAPTHRWAIAITRDGDVRFAEFHNGGTLQLPSSTLALQTVNDWPPPGGGALLLTPQFGPLPAAPNLTVLALQPSSGTPPYAAYRVQSVVDAERPEPPGYYLAGGQAAAQTLSELQDGDTVAALPALDPPIDDVVTAIGGGPLLVKDGRWFADPDGPSSGEFLTHMPATGAGITQSGTLLLFQIDGRQPALSIGVLQPQFAALMIAFGVHTGLQFDGGGSSTLVARMPGDSTATVRNSPSDGEERRVADGLFLYSDAPRGPPSRIVVLPQTLRAMPGARIPLRIAVTDDAGHPIDAARTIRAHFSPASLGRFEGTTAIAEHAGGGTVQVRAGSLAAQVPVRFGESITRLMLLPLRPNTAPGGTVQMAARAFDPDGFPVALPATLPWRADAGSIDAAGFYRAGQRDGVVQLQIRGVTVSQRVLVGAHDAPLSLLHAVTFATAPKSEPGGISESDPCDSCIALRYDFTSGERAAYAQTALHLPTETRALALDVYGDAKGETLRVAVHNAINERFLYTVARIDWHGWRRVEVQIPPALVAPLTLKAIYVIDRVRPQDAASHASGAIALRALTAIVAGSGAPSP